MMALIIKSFNLGFTSLNFIADSSVPGLMDTKENMLRWTDFKRSHFSHSSREEGSAKGALGKRHIFFFLNFSTAFGLKHEGTAPQLLVEKQERNDVTESLVAALQGSRVCQLVNGYLSWDPEVEVCV